MNLVLNNEKKPKQSYMLSIVVCTLGRPSLKGCLESIFNQSYDKIEIVVVSPDKMLKDTIRDTILNYREQGSAIKFFLSKKANVSFQRNTGIMNASGNIVAFIDDDSVADRNWISNLIKHYEDKRVMCVGGKILPKFFGKVPKELKDISEGIFSGFIGQTTLKANTAIRIKRPLLWASNISFRKDIFAIVGGFDEELGKTPDKLLCEEEIDMQARILNKGYKIIYEPKAVVTHLIDPQKLTREYFIKRAFWQGVSEVIKIRKYGKFQNELNRLKSPQLNYVSNIKLIELFLELSASNTLNERIRASYEIGRIAALLYLSNRQLKKGDFFGGNT